MCRQYKALPNSRILAVVLDNNPFSRRAQPTHVRRPFRLVGRPWSPGIRTGRTGHERYGLSPPPAVRYAPRTFRATTGRTAASTCTATWARTVRNYSRRDRPVSAAPPGSRGPSNASGSRTRCRRRSRCSPPPLPAALAAWCTSATCG